MNSNTVRIESPRFGPLEVAPERVIEFPLPLSGFNGLQRFSLFHPEDSEPKYFILQSLDQPDIAFTVADPALLGFNYEIALSDAESESIDLKDPAEAAVIVLLIKDGDNVRANLNAPLIINLRTRKGLQHTFAKLDYQVTLRGSGA